MTDDPDDTAPTVEQPAPEASATDLAPGAADPDTAGASDAGGAPATAGPPETADPLPLGRVQLTPLQESPSPRDAAALDGEDAARDPTTPEPGAGAHPRSILWAMRRLRERLCDLRPRAVRAVARVRDAARLMRARRGSKASGELSRGSGGGSHLMPILISLNIALLAATMAMLLLE